MIAPLFKRNMISGVKVFLIIFAVICMYTTVIIYMYDPKLSDMLNDYQQALPEMMSAVGMTGMATNLLEWIQIYLYGFIMLLFPLVFIIVLMQKLVMGYVDSGAMANLLATPNSRRQIIVTQAVSAVSWLAVLMGAVTIVGIASSQMFFPDELDVKRYVILNGSTLLLQIAVCGIVFFAACVCNEAKHYYALGAGIPILFFLMQMIANMGEKLEWLRNVTIYTLLPAAEIVQGKRGYWLQNLALVAIAIALFTGGSYLFCRRDLSL